MKYALRFTEIEARRYLRVWKASVFSNFFTPVLFLAGMGLGLGSMVDQGPNAAAFAGIGYLSFLAPGLLAASAMHTAANESSWPVLGAIKWDKTYYATLATPISVADLVFGHLVWVTVRLFMICIAFAFVMLLFGACDLLSALAAIGPAMLTGLAFAAPIMALAGWLKNDTGLSVMFRFFIMPLYLFSGTFFPISQLPSVLEIAAYFVPLWHGVELTRHFALGTPLELPVLLHVGYLAAWCAAGTALAIASLRRRLQP